MALTLRALRSVKEATCGPLVSQLVFEKDGVADPSEELCDSVYLTKRKSGGRESRPAAARRGGQGRAC